MRASTEAFLFTTLSIILPPKLRNKLKGGNYFEKRIPLETPCEYDSYVPYTIKKQE